MENIIKNKIIFVRSNPVNPDSRVEKESLALKNAGYDISILCWDRSLNSPKQETTAFGKINRLRLKAPYGKIILFPLIIIWWIYEFIWLIINEFDYVHACDFDTVVPAYLAARIKNKKIIYDIFDYYADILPFKKNSILYKIIQKIDTFFINNCDSVILVDQSRIQQIHPAKPRRTTLIYNTPKEELGGAEGKNDNIFKLFYAGILP